METITGRKPALRGGEWLTKESIPQETFIPEDFSEEHLMIKDLAHQFITTEVVPILERIEKLEPGLMPSLME